MQTAAIVLSLPLILELVFAPMNLWTGRTIGNFVHFTGFDARIGRTVFAPIKLASAVLLAGGLAVRSLSVAGAGLALVICVLYLVRLSSTNRRDAVGLVGFTLFGLLAGTLLVVRLRA